MWTSERKKQHPRGCCGTNDRGVKGKRYDDRTLGDRRRDLTNSPLPTYPNGFPKEIIDEFSKRTGRGVLCNKPYSGTDVIRDYGEEHMKTGDLIVYTSADSVFQIAAHEDIVPVETLYEYCQHRKENATGRAWGRPCHRKTVYRRAGQLYQNDKTP